MHSGPVILASSVIATVCSAIVTIPPFVRNGGLLDDCHQTKEPRLQL
jgi:hypothetical protein